MGGGSRKKPLTIGNIVSYREAAIKALVDFLKTNKEPVLRGGDKFAVVLALEEWLKAKENN